MPQTPLSGATPYLTAARLALYRDTRTWLELLRDDDTPATLADALNPATTDGQTLLAALMSSAGEIEENAMVGGKYLPADLAAIVTAAGNMAARIEGLNADLFFWRLAKRRWPKCKPEDISGAVEALAALEKLEKGITIFGTVEAVAASVPTTTDLDREEVTIHEAAPFFGPRGRSRWRE